eukprot:3382509-Pyramimonas_sp.AAC.1
MSHAAWPVQGGQASAPDQSGPKQHQFLENAHAHWRRSEAEPLPRRKRLLVRRQAQIPDLRRGRDHGDGPTLGRLAEVWDERRVVFRST